MYNFFKEIRIRKEIFLKVYNFFFFFLNIIGIENHNNLVESLKKIRQNVKKCDIITVNVSNDQFSGDCLIVVFTKLDFVLILMKLVKLSKIFSGVYFPDTSCRKNSYISFGEVYNVFLKLLKLFSLALTFVKMSKNATKMCDTI